jgi:2-polyprenyl-6-hydroxyphenyl methylase / 3-demethylubiquinone-9 3-methyltransferase
MRDDECPEFERCDGTSRAGAVYKGGFGAATGALYRVMDRGQAMNSDPLNAGSSTVDAAEVARFSALASEWWDPRGKMAPLHKFNPVRLAYIRDQVTSHFGRDRKRLDSLKGLRILDIGCGGGVLSEPLARLGASVVGADPAMANVEAARRHAAQSNLIIDYRCTTAEALADAGERFDIVLAMEVVEHVADVSLFLRRCAEMVKPGGLMIVATLNRTLKSFALAIVGAEYILRWLPRGTHRWDKFVMPNELEGALERGGLQVTDREGMVYDLFADAWRLADDTEVNYLVTAEKPAGISKGLDRGV